MIDNLYMNASNQKTRHFFSLLSIAPNGGSLKEMEKNNRARNIVVGGYIEEELQVECWMVKNLLSFLLGSPVACAPALLGTFYSV